VAKPFYDRLHELNYAGQPLAAGQIYPWDGNQASTDDYALANTGQVKNLFSFVLPDTAVDPDDTDGDGLPDAWEMLHFGNLDQTADGDYDNDGFTNLQEYEAGSDPAVDYYGGTPPIIEVVSGNDQNYRPGEFLPKPLVVRVKNTAGTPLAGAPVVFTASPEEGLLSPTKDGTADLKPQIVVLTDAQGLAQAWLQCP